MIPRSMAAASATPRISAETAVHTSAGRTDKPLGRLADAALRKWKMAAHASFDPLWKTGPFRGRRKAAYGWLAEQMGLPIEKTHIGMFDIPQCQEVIKIIEKGDFKNAQFQ